MYQGNYVLSQLVKHIPYYQFNKCVKKYNGHYQIKSFSCWNQFLAMLFGQLSHRESLRDVVNCLNSQGGKIYNLGFSTKVKRSTLAKANELRDWRIYQDLAEMLITEARKLYIDDKQFKLELDGACYAIDSSVIELCLNVFPWAKLKTVRAAIKLHMQLDLQGNIPTLFSLTTAKTHDLKFLDQIEIEANAYYIMDRGYWDSCRLFAINQKQGFFVIRDKRAVTFKRIYSNRVDKIFKEKGLRCDQIIKLIGGRTSKEYPDKLRRVKYFDKENKRYLIFLTNNFNIPALMVADLYRHRWQVELFFKWIKQHLKIKSFWGYSDNAVKTQICIAICSYLLVAIVKKKLKIKRDLYEILQILNVTLLTKNPLVELLSEFELEENDKQLSKQLNLLDY